MKHKDKGGGKARRRQGAAMAKTPMVKRLRRRLTAIFSLLTGLVLAALLGINLWRTVQRVEAEQVADLLTSISTMANELVYYTDAGMVDFAAIDNRYNLVTAAVVNEEPVYISEAAEADQLLEDFDVFEIGFEYWETGESVDEALAPFFQQYSGVDVQFAYDVQEVGEDIQTISDWMLQKAHAADKQQAEKLVAANEVHQFVLSGTAAPQQADAIMVGMDGVSLQGQGGLAYEGVQISIAQQASNSTYSLLVVRNAAANKQQMQVLYMEYGAVLLLGLVALAFISWLLARMVTGPVVTGMQRQADFVAAASHELRSPLAVMRSSLSAVRVAEDEAEKGRYHTAAEAEAERMSRLVDDLLLLAGGDAGSWKLQTGSVDVDTLLIETGEQFRPLAAAGDVTLTLALPDEALGNVAGDEGRLHQILAVLVDNALQYAPEDSEITLRARVRKGRVEITVEDHGPGVPDEEKALVFHRFYRADKSRSDKSHFGLGLSVARELAELHGGTLTLRDTPGGGATFRLSLPAGGKDEAL